MVVFTFAVGYLTDLSVEKEALILASLLFVIGFAFYIGFKPSASYNKRATFIFVGAFIVGFSIWAVMVLSFNAAGITSQIASSAGANLFAITSLIICLISGAFIGDLTGKNRERISIFVNDKLRK
ncbi:MAG: hypothetical protein ABSD92_13190 [Candidatus Bathyarchaeia archaeon]